MCTEHPARVWILQFLPGERPQHFLHHGQAGLMPMRPVLVEFSSRALTPQLPFPPLRTCWRGRAFSGPSSAAVPQGCLAPGWRLTVFLCSAALTTTLPMSWWMEKPRIWACGTQPDKKIMTDYVPVLPADSKEPD